MGSEQIPTAKVSIFLDNGKREDFPEPQYREAQLIAERELVEFPSLIKARIKQILVPDALSTTDLINLFAVSIFSEEKDRPLFALTVRFLSSDLPDATLNSVEEDTLAEALRMRGRSLDELVQYRDSIF